MTTATTSALPDLISQGQTNEQIAERLVLSLKTVRNHVSNICGKLQVADRTQAVIRAREAGHSQIWNFSNLLCVTHSQ